MKECVFCSIINNLLPAAKIYENANVLIFLDHRPLFQGHCLLVPKCHYGTLNDLPNDQIEHFFTKLQQLNRVVTTAMEARGTFVAMNNVVSQSVPHLHVHVVPRTPGDGLKGFFWPRKKYPTESELNDTLKKLQTTWQALYK